MVKRPHRRQVLKAVGAAGIAGAFAGCEAPTSNPTTTVDRVPDCETSVVEPTVSGGSFTLVHGRQQEGARLLEETKEVFQERYESTVRIERSPYSPVEHLRTVIPEGDGPHLFTHRHTIAGRFVEDGFLSEQGENLRVEECVYSDPAWDVVDYQGPEMDDPVTVGLPFAGECPALLYNRDILDELGVEPPETFAEWLSIMEEFHDPQQGQYGLAQPLNAYFASWAAHAYGGEIYDGEADELGITSDAVSRGLDILLDDLRPYIPSTHTDASPYTEEAQVAVFENATAPFLINGPWVEADLAAAEFEYGVQPIPTPPGATARPYSSVQVLFFADRMTTDSTAAAARQFAEWYTTSDDRIRELVTTTSFVPVKNGFTERDQLSTTARGFARQFETSDPVPQNPKMNDVWAPFETAVREAFETGADVGPLLEAAATEIRQTDRWQ